MDNADKTKWTIKNILEWTTSYFKTKGINTSRLDAEVLLAYIIGADRLYLYLNLDRPLTTQERFRYRELVRRRALREPVSLIIGRKEFWSVSLNVEHGVLIPRPDTEILVQVVLDVLKNKSDPEIFEIGVGSGAVSIAIASERSDSMIYASDISMAALKIAYLNVQTTNTYRQINLFGSDLFSALRPDKLFDVICSNPPYIPESLIEELEPEIHFEPLSALTAGVTGLDIIEKLIPQAINRLKPSCWLVIEIGSDQQDPVSKMFKSAGYDQISMHNNLSGKVRVIKGRSNS